MITYRITEKTTTDDEGEQCTTFGIEYSTHHLHRVIHDITLCKNTAEYIVNSFNEHQPEPVHIMEILENFLLDFTDF